MNKKIILTSIISLLLFVVPASAALAIDSAINKAQKKLTHDESKDATLRSRH